MFSKELQIKPLKVAEYYLIGMGNTTQSEK